MSFIKNFISHNIINLVNIIIPIVTYPYIISKLGLSSYGTAIFIINIFSIGVIFCEFAFSLTGSKKIVRCRNNREESLIFSQIILSKFALLIIILPILIVFTSLKSEVVALMLLVGSFIILAEVFNLTWYFVAKGKTHVAAVCVVVVRLISIPLIFTFIKGRMDAINYLIIFSSTAMFISLFHMFFAVKIFNLKFRFVGFRHVYVILNHGKGVFFGRIASSLKDRYLGVWLGFFASHEILAVYDILFKITNLVMGPVYSVSVILFPRLSGRSKKQVFNLNNFLIYGVIGVVVISSFLACFSDYVLLYFDKSGALLKYSMEMKLMLVSMPFLFVSSMLGSCYFIIKGKVKAYNGSILASLFLMMFLSFLLLEVGLISVIIVVFLFLVTAFTECLIRSMGYYYYEKK